MFESQSCLPSFFLPLSETSQPGCTNQVFVSIRQKWYQHQGKRALHYSRTGLNPRVFLLFTNFCLLIPSEPLQVPWALTYSRWYHQFPAFPLKALEQAALLSQYTLTDLSTWITSSDSVKSALKIFKSGSDDDPNDPLLNSAHALYGAQVPRERADTGTAFMDWLVSPDGGQEVIRTFSINGQVVVTGAPR
jgi:hypothetical protein